MKAGIEYPYTLKKVKGNAANNVYAIGTHGILHYDGKNWKAINAKFADNQWSDIWLIDNEVFAAGGEKIIHFKDGKWIDMESGLHGGDYLNAVWGTAANNVYAVGSKSNNTGGKYILHYDGVKWNDTHFSTNPENSNKYDDRWIFGISGLTDKDIYIVGSRGLFFHYDGTEWSAVDTKSFYSEGVVGELNFIKKIDSDLFVCGEKGIVLRYQDNKWQDISLKNKKHSVRAMWKNPDNKIYLLSSDATLEKLGNLNLFRLEKDRWELLNPAISDIAVLNKDLAFAVGNYGTAKIYSNGQWKTIKTDIAENLNAIWGKSKDSMFAVGDNGIILHYDGTKWTKLDTDIDEDLNDIWGSSDSNIYTVGSMNQTYSIEGSIWHYDSSKWTKIIPNNKVEITGGVYSISGTSENDIYAAGSDVLHFDGSVWKNIEIPNRSSTISKIRIASKDNIYFVTTGNSVFRHNNGNWSTFHYPIKDQTKHTSLTDIYATKNKVYVAVTITTDSNTMSSKGIIAQYDGKNWNNTDSFNFVYLTSISGIEGKPLFIAGKGGYIGSYNPSSVNQDTSTIQKIEEKDINRTITVEKEDENQSKIDLNKRDKYGRSELHIAVSHNNLLKIKQLLDTGAKVDAEDSFGRTPLHYAAFEGYVEIAKILLANGANINAIDKTKQWTPLFFAYYNKHSDMVDLLIKKGADQTIKDKLNRTASDYIKD
ncbi:ankyrin repeat domain-containing protein [Sulfurovum sp.]|nr:ankyrin repeat domain-containing protein [Sulfurovum sp.]